MSKRCILISLLILLISACAPQVTVPQTPEAGQSLQPAPSNTVKPESTLDVIAAWTSMAGTKDAMVRPTGTASATAVDTATAAFSLCPGAPGPYVAVGRQVTVVAENVDKLKLRSAPALSADSLQELDRFTQLTVVGGPVCVQEAGASYWFWQVEVHPGGEVGWVAEGDVTHSFIIVSVGQQQFPKNTPTAPTPSACPPIRGPYGPGVQASVVTDDSDKLKLRSAPVLSPDNVIRELDQYTRLEIVGGPMCVQSAETGIGYWLWKVKVISTGKTGWVAEGDGRNHFIEPIIPP
jgi:hypothetical protein